MDKFPGKHIIWLILGGLVFVASCDNHSVSEEQAQSFLKYYPLGAEPNTGTIVVQTTDGYAILCNFENETGPKNINLVFTDEFGRPKTGSPVTIESDYRDHGYSMIELGNGFLISGSSGNASGTGGKQGYLANVSHNGSVLWEHRYDWYYELEFRDVSEASDGQLIMTGYAKDSPDVAEDRDVIIFKTNTEGDSTWIRRSNYREDDIGEKIIEDQNQNRLLILSTARNVDNIRQSYIRIINTNKDGRGPTSEPSDQNYLVGKDIAVNTDGEIYVLGNFEDPSSRVSQIYLAEITLTGLGNETVDFVRSAIIPYNESLHASSFATINGGLAIGGRIEQNDDILFLEVDNAFQVIGTPKVFGAKFYQGSEDIIYTDDGGFALTGSVDLGGERTSMLLKIDSERELK
jgi:hypothetical protein